jgi:hypothetical protein
MIRSAKDKGVRQTYEMRRDALKAVLAIEGALEVYQARFGQYPSDLSRLVQTGLLPELPDDPYGGMFYLDEQGKVRTSSKFATPSAEQ